MRDSIFKRMGGRVQRARCFSPNNRRRTVLLSNLTLTRRKQICKKEAIKRRRPSIKKSGSLFRHQFRLSHPTNSKRGSLLTTAQTLKMTSNRMTLGYLHQKSHSNKTKTPLKSINNAKTTGRPVALLAANQISSARVSRSYSPIKSTTFRRRVERRGRVSGG